MKKLNVLLLIMFCTMSLFGQENSKFQKTVFVELAGIGYNYSLNYDMRFVKSKKSGLGFRAGVSYAKEKPVNSFNNDFFRITLPVELNYLLNLSNQRHFLDLGLGYIPHYVSENLQSNNNIPIFSDGWLHFTAPSIGYRFQGKKGLMVRVNFCKFIRSYKIFEERQWESRTYPGFAVGYSF